MRFSLKIIIAILLTIAAFEAMSAPPESRLKGPKGVDYGAMGEVYGPVGQRDTMWRLANKFRHKNDVSVYQVMVAIFKKNPQAFEHDNLNGLMQGSYLKIPSHAEVKEIEPAYAKKRADTDDELWADRLSGNFSEGKKQAMLQPIEDAKQIDVTVAKQEIQEKLDAVREEQATHLNNIQSQFSANI
jgi:pilus assembly protein FimV